MKNGAGKMENGAGKMENGAGKTGSVGKLNVQILRHSFSHICNNVRKRWTFARGRCTYGIQYCLQWFVQVHLF